MTEAAQFQLRDISQVKSLALGSLLTPSPAEKLSALLTSPPQTPSNSNLIYEERNKGGDLRPACAAELSFRKRM